jgi:hypothetical protein
MNESLVKAKKNIKKQSTIYIIIVLTVIFAFILPLLLANNLNFYFSWISAVSGVATMFLAFSLFDKLDSKKAAFSRELDAVDKLASALFNVDFYAIVGNRSIFKDGPLLYRDYLKFSLNRTALKFAGDHIEKFGTLDVYFSREMIEKLRPVAEISQNIWIPVHLKNILKPVVFADRMTRLSSDNDKDFILITTREQARIKTQEIYSFSYDDMVIADYADLHKKYELILKALSDYYSDRLGVEPDFQGH